MPIDSFDSQILKLLTDDSRTTSTKLGKKVGLSRFAVRNRIEKMYREGVILEPTVVVNPYAVGFRRTMFCEFKTNPHEPWLAKLLEDTNACDLLDGITGEYSLFARLRVEDDEHFSHILKRIDEVVSRSYFKKYRVINAIHIFKESSTRFKRDYVSHDLDKNDLKLVNILMNQGNYDKRSLPITTVSLSRLLQKSGFKTSQPAVFQRLRTLQKKDVILRNSIRVDWNKVDLKTKVILRIKANPNFYNSVAEDFLANMDEITDLYRTGEEYGLLSIVRVRDISKFNSFLLRLFDEKNIIDTHTTFVLEERKSSPTFLNEKSAT